MGKKIVFEPEFNGTLQAFASDSIYIGDKCNFIYPSVIGLLPSKNGIALPGIFINENSNVQGTVLCYEAVFDIRKRPIISIAKNCHITGEIFTTSMVDLKGKLSGEVICEKFILRTASSVYENHLLDCEIDGNLLPQGYLHSRLRNEEGKHVNVACFITR